MGCTLRRSGGLRIKLGCGKGRAGGLPFSAAHPTLFRCPTDRLFCAAHRLTLLSYVQQPAENSPFLFGNTALQPARSAGPPISVILPLMTISPQTPHSLIPDAPAAVHNSSGPSEFETGSFSWSTLMIIY